MKNPALVYQAISFYNAYINLENLEKNIPQDVGEMILCVPKMVNGAFSAELTIKAILTEQGVPYSKEHNLKILFDKLPIDIQNKVWRWLIEKAPEYLDAEKRENELLIMSEAFAKWRYCYEGEAPAFDIRFLSVFTNAMIIVMFELGYNVSLTQSQKELTLEELAEIDKKIEDNRRECMKNNQEKIKKKRERGMI